MGGPSYISWLLESSIDVNHRKDDGLRTAQSSQGREQFYPEILCCLGCGFPLLCPETTCIRTYLAYCVLIFIQVKLEITLRWEVNTTDGLCNCVMNEYWVKESETSLLHFTYHHTPSVSLIRVAAVGTGFPS
jgi:hypothetical protein